MTCTIIPFPTQHRVRKIHHTARLLSERSGKGADRYWQQVIGGMRSQMEAAQIEPETIDAELHVFANCVFGVVYQMGRSA